MRSLVDRYLHSAAFLNLAESTKPGYRHGLRLIEADFGDLPLSALSDRRIRGEFLEWRDRIGESSPRQADNHFKVLARLISWGFDRGYAPANPCQRPGKLCNATRSNKVWTSEQEAAFLKKAPAHLRLPLLPALWTGQRRGDLLSLTWSAYDGENIRLRQRKTGAPVLVPVGQAVRQALDAAKAELGDVPAEKLGSFPILTTSSGTAWTGSGFSASWRKACAKVGVVGVTFHDLRGTAVTRMAVAGCTVPEIAAITGHSLRDVHQILDAHYMDRDPELAINAIRKREEKEGAPN
jgi:integrase